MAKFQDAAPKVLELIEQGATYKDAAEQAGIGERTFYDWMRDKPQFSQSVHKAKEVSDRNAVAKVEATLLKLATGYEYEDVRTEYGSEKDPKTGEMKPVIRKQVRVKKIVPASTEAIKFFLSNKAPEVWKNRLEQNNTGNLNTKLQLEVVSGNPDDAEFPSNEAEVDVSR